MLAGAYALVGLSVSVGCKRRDAEPAVAAGKENVRRTVAQAVEQTSQTCVACHADIHAGWAKSDHALANRPVDAAHEAEAFKAHPTISDGGTTMHLDWPANAGDKPTLTDVLPDGTKRIYTPEFVLGWKPLRQMLLNTGNGHIQPTDMAYDPAKKEWFNAFGQEGRRHGEWGHWTGRGMNWNSMCAHCHMTGYHKNYDAAKDAYASTWVEHGVGCIQCHGALPKDHATKYAAKLNKPGDPFDSAIVGNRQRAMETCAPCHARNELLTDTFQPGDSYHDHYRITLPVQPGVYWPDGQQRDEDFNWTSVLTSRMGHAGVTCMDCHDPHTNKTILPVENNQLCLQCHAAPGRRQPNGTLATVIDPLTHSHHTPGTPGSRCVDCHMPTTPYMQRAPRHDHGWLKPDPLLTKELGIPNACSSCHSDKPIETLISATDTWYGEKMNSRQRARARAVDAAQKGQPGATDQLLALLKDEDIPAWRATLLLLALPDASQRADVVAAARQALTAADPLERSAGVQILNGHPQAGEWLRPLLKDPVRLVRLDAAWALSRELASDSPERRELDAYLKLNLDQPSGRYRLGQDLANRGQLAAAEREMSLATKWDPYSGGIHEARGFVLAQLGRAAEAGAAFYRAGQLAPNDAQAPYRAALAYAEGGYLQEAENALRESVRRDPQMARAWYNLGLLLAQKEQLVESVEALKKAEASALARREPSPDFAYALATVLLRQNDRATALAAAKRALEIDASYAPARQFIQQVGGR